MANRRPPAKPRTCDAPGCTERVKRGMLMCRPHWFALPYHLRQAISSAWKERRIGDWSANCLEARSILAGRRESSLTPNPVSPERAAALRDRILGERPDA